QGPTYIRANESITILPDAYVTIKDESYSSEGNTTENEYTILRTTMHQLSPTSTSTANRSILDGSPSTCEFNQNESTNTIARLDLNMPTCYEKFGSEEIEEHADVCAESAWSVSEQQYVSLMSDIVNLDDHVDQEPVVPDNIKTELADVTRTLQEILALRSTELMCNERVCWMITYLSV
ncbi:---NA---, partial [Paramuricea clavata]